MTSHGSDPVLSPSSDRFTLVLFLPKQDTGVGRLRTSLSLSPWKAASCQYLWSRKRGCRQWGWSLVCQEAMVLELGSWAMNKKSPIRRFRFYKNRDALLCSPPTLRQPLRSCLPAPPRPPITIVFFENFFYQYIHMYMQRFVFMDVWYSFVHNCKKKKKNQTKHTATECWLDELQSIHIIKYD